LRINLSDDLALHNSHFLGGVHEKPSFGVLHAFGAKQSDLSCDLKNRFITLMALTPI
jgi:hypothetical protein